MSGFREEYCSRHNMIYYDIRCPQCREDEEKEQFKKIIEPLKKAEQKREAQEQLRLILAKLEKAPVVKETTRYKLFTCPFCTRPSLFFSNSTGYECHNEDCPLTASIRYYTERANS